MIGFFKLLMCYRLAVRKDRKTFWLAWLLITVGVSSPAYSEPFIPPQDEHVLERVARGTRFNQGALLKTANLEDAIALAREYIELSRHSGDPRFSGRAEALLAPWSEQRPVPSDVLLLRATVRQHRHDFDAALEDLETVIAMEPRNAQALLTHATINQVVGDYAAARSSCLRLYGIASDLTTVACIGGVSGLTGRAEAAFQALVQALHDQPQGSVEERQWALIVIADIAVRLGRYKQADGYFRQALALRQPSVYLLSQYADFLLETQRFEEVLALLEHRESVDALAVRLTRAIQHLRLSGAASIIRKLAKRVDAIRQRGDKHPGTEAQVLLYFFQRPADALRLALQNWQIQREPKDARLVLEAAIAARQPAAAQPVLDWLEQWKVQDVRLDRLRRHLGS